MGWLRKSTTTATPGPAAAATAAPLSADRTPRRGYHHGDLRSALLDAAQAVLTEHGVSGFSLRETARRAGVSAAAPKHHFADSRALLTALAAKAFNDLADRLEHADQTAPSGAAAIHAQAQAYLHFALEQRAAFELMWQTGRFDAGNADLQAGKARAFLVLDQRVRGGGSEPLAQDDARLAPTLACWSIVHGFAHMAIEGTFGTDAAEVRATAPALLTGAVDLFLKGRSAAATITAESGTHGPDEQQSP